MTNSPSAIFQKPVITTSKEILTRLIDAGSGGIRASTLLSQIDGGEKAGALMSLFAERKVTSVAEPDGSKPLDTRVAITPRGQRTLEA